MFVNEEKLNTILKETASPSDQEVGSVLKKGALMQGLSLRETAILLNSKGQQAEERLFSTAADIKQKIYGDRLVFFAPLYLSSHCVNDCAYCGFQSSNKALRKKLSPHEIHKQVECLINMGHKRLLLEFGEDPKTNTIDYICQAIDAVYSVKRQGGEIRRVNLNIAATTEENYKLIKEKGIGTYQLFQETYHRATYEGLHRGPKADYERQLSAMDRAFAAGIDDVGLGVLFGLYDYRFEVLGLISHAEHLQKKFGVGPHTISIPRFRPADGVTMTPAHPLNDEDFLKLIAILRIAVPYTGMIITTRETAAVRERAFNIGITQASAASRTEPGGFGKDAERKAAQFSLADKRTLDEVAIGVMRQGYTPSFCTACYRKKRTGEAFMDLAKPGDIHHFCQPNSILTLMEYVEDHASYEGRQLGLKTIERDLQAMEKGKLRRETEARLLRIKEGARDLYF